MSKELTFTDDNTVKYLDTSSSFDLAITQDGTAFDLTNATAIDVKAANASGYVFDKSIDMATVTQPLAGVITMPVDAEVMNALTPDDYSIEVWVTLSSLVTPGSQEGVTDDDTTESTTTSTTSSYTAIFPSDDTVGFTINSNLTNVDGETVDAISLASFEGELNGKVNTADTVDWQKTKITADSGAEIYELTASNGDDLNAYLKNLPIGITTFAVLAGVTNNPSTVNTKGLIHVTSNNYGVGYLIDANGNQWSIVLNGSSTPIYTKLSTSTDLSTGLATKEDKLSFTPADDSTVLHNNTLNYMNQDNSGIVVGNDKNFGLIKRNGYTAGLAIGSGPGYNFHLMTTTDAILSNTSSYTDVWTIAPTTGELSIKGGTYFTPADDSTVLHNNTLNYMNQDNSGIVVGNDKNFGLIKRNGYTAGLAIGSGPGYNFHLMTTTDAILSNTSSYTDVWTIAPTTGELSIKGGTYFTPADDSKVVHLSTGTTTDRPTGQVTGYQYFDTTLNKPIWYTGTAWVDATGTAVQQGGYN